MKNFTYSIGKLCLSMLFVFSFLPSFSQQIHRSIKISTGDQIGFLEYKPVDYSQHPEKKYPLIIFLHGIGERGTGVGTDLDRVANFGLPRIIKYGHKMTFTWNGKTETFLVLSPQCPSKYGMWPKQVVEDLIKYAKTTLQIDEDRIYLTGLSMGAGGSYIYMSNSQTQVNNLAAAATICPPCVFNSGQYIADANLPLWSFHAKDDPIVNWTCTQRAIDKINSFKPAVKPLLDYWPTGGHQVWDRVYTDTNYIYQGAVNIYEWFLGQRRGAPVNKLPVANAGKTITITTGTGIANLDASASTDADGKIVRYVWKKIGGPNAGWITTARGSDPSTTVSGLTVSGTYQYQLSVVDDRAAYSRDTLTVLVTSGAPIPNKAPLAKAGNGVTITLPTNTLTLDGTASSDADGSIASYKWTKTAGPAATIATAGKASTSVSGLVEGVYTFTLEVIDNKGLSSKATVTVTVKPAPLPANNLPVANASADTTITLPSNKTKLSGAGSSDKDGSITSYKWIKVSGPAATITVPTAVTTDVTGLVEGVYVFKLTVTDNRGGSNEAQVTITVKPAPVVVNVKPVADAGANTTITLPTNKVTLNGTKSLDADGSITAYLWTKVEGPTPFLIANKNSAISAFENLVEGSYKVALTVTDNKGATSNDTVTVKVNAAPPPPNKKPISAAGLDVVITLPLNKVNLNGSGSSDSDGSIASFQWTKISGPAQFVIGTSNKSTTSVTGLVQGTYLFRLYVTDNRGGVDNDTVKVTVKPAPVVANKAPKAQAGTNLTIVLPVDSVELDGSKSYDSDGSIASYEWTQIDGPEASTIVSSSEAETKITGLKEGSYYFRLKVIDNKNAQSADTVFVFVKAAPVYLPPPNKVPVAKAGEDLSIQLPLDHVVLDGSASYDTDGTVVNYEWRKLSGPDQFEFSNADSSINEADLLTEGEYQFLLTVKDNDGATATDIVKVTVIPAPNVGPIANAGFDAHIELPENQITLDGSESSDPDGEIVSYSWAKAGGPTGLTIVNSTSEKANVVGLQEGVYVFRLTIIDNKGVEATDEVTITVNTESPSENDTTVAYAGSDKAVNETITTTTLDGSKSYDSDGSIKSYHWTMATGDHSAKIISPDSATTAVSNLAPGEYVFELTVTDNLGNSASDRVKVTVAGNARVEAAMKLYPNPATSNFNMQITSDTTGTGYLIIYNSNGVPVKKMQIEKHTVNCVKSVGISELQKGVYHVEVMIGNKQRMVKTFIKN